MQISLRRLSVSARFLVVLVIGLAFPAGISVLSLLDLRNLLIQDRISDVQHLDQVAYSTVAFYHEQASKGLMTDAAARAAAAAAVRAMHYDDGNYFFIWDLDGASIAHGAQRTLEGKRFGSFADAEKNPVVGYMVDRLLEVARSDRKQGVSSYRIPKSGQTEPLEKLAYSRLFEPWGWSIGTGAYVDDIDSAFRSQALSAFGVFMTLIAVASTMTYFIGSDLTRAINRLSARVTGVAQGELDGEVPETDRHDEVGAMARALLVLRDNSREAAELRLDHLTGLPTRKLLMDRLRQSKAQCARTGFWAALLLIDMDRFKLLNDIHGHDVGDILLREVGRRLAAGVRAGDTVARLGGDEFVVVLVDAGRTEGEAATVVKTACGKMLSMLNEPYRLGTIVHNSTASIGVTLFRDDSCSSEDLLKQADLAMYTSKRTGRNVCRFFDTELEAAMRERATLEKELREAIKTGQLRPHYQPQMGSDGTLRGAEALLRWEHPRRGLVPPGEFIPLAEESGLILPIGQVVLEAACRQLAAWADRPELAYVTISVNVSVRQFQQPDFVAQVVALLRATGADPGRLTLELTENLAIQNLESIVGKMTELKAEGVSFALDDFGIGYSSLHVLKSLPLNELKIDRAFVRNVLTDENDAAIAKMIIALARTVGLEVVAEGIETTEQWDFLARSGCDYGQGYLFGRALPADGFEAFAADWAKLARVPRSVRRRVGLNG